MTTQQQMILEAIVNKMDPHQVTVDHQYANTGHIRRIDPNTLMATRSLSFTFYDDHATFKIAGDPPGDWVRGDPFASHWYGRPRSEGQRASVKSTPIELVDAVCNYLKGATP